VNTWDSLAAGGLMSLLTTEFSEMGPWLARRVTKLSARILLDRSLRQQYDEEWLAGIEDTPGKLIPLGRAAGILFITVPTLNYRYLDDWWKCTIWLPVASWNLRLQLKHPRALAWGASPDFRSWHNGYNKALKATCRALRDGPADQRAEALDSLQVLLSDPPPWTIGRYARSALERDIPLLRGALTKRGYLPESSSPGM
jgi:hypothetical protein